MIEEYRQEYARFNSELTREFYLYHSGLKADFRLDEVYGRYRNLFDQESAARLRLELHSTPEHYETGRAALRHLLTFATNQFLESGVGQLTEAISQFENRASLEWQGRNLTFQDVVVAIATETDRAYRGRLYDWRTQVIASSNDLRKERLAKLHSGARNIDVIRPHGSVHAGVHSNSGQYNGGGRTAGSGGAAAGAARRETYSSYTALYEDLLRLDLKELAGDAQALLKGTEHLYTARLAEAVKRDLKISLQEASRQDAIYFVHLSRYDDRFPASEMFDVYRGTLEGLGIKPSAQNNIVIDDQDRPLKSARAFCAPIRVPEEIVLVYRPLGGQSDYMSLLHEGGHAQHYAWTAPGLPPEFKYTGDPALTETYAFLFNHLPSDRDWLESLLGFDNAADFIASMMLVKLFTVRRYAAKLIYETGLHESGDISGAAKKYAELQTEATRFRTGEAEYLYDLDDGFYSAGYLRAWAFEVAIRDYIKERFGKRWWTNRHAGKFLKEIWETGERYTAEEMASQIGIGPIRFDRLIDEFTAALG
ncbi:MAG TPA: hypothetical protein VJX67_23815 [Blastocatellia bacterium]|nr:hypothetical protein [Blastocatellia bacterium]